MHTRDLRRPKNMRSNAATVHIYVTSQKTLKCMLVLYFVDCRSIESRLPKTTSLQMKSACYCVICSLLDNFNESYDIINDVLRLMSHKLYVISELQLIAF